MEKSIIFWLAILCCHSGFAVSLVIEIIAKTFRYKTSRVFRVAVPLACMGIGQVLNLSSIIERLTSKLGLFSYMNASANFEKVQQ